MNHRIPLAILVLLLCLGPAAAQAGDDTGSLPLRLRIVDEAGQPVSGARVQAGNTAEDGSLHQAGLDLEEKEVVRTGETSDDGVVRLSGFPLERAVWIVLEKEGFRPELRSLMLSRSVTCPEIEITLHRGEGTVDWGLIDKLPADLSLHLPEFLLTRVHPGCGHSFPEASVEPDFQPRIRLGQSAVVSGRVRTPEGTPVAGALLFVSWDDDSRQVAAGADGLFHLEVPRGRVQITARAPDFYGETEVLEVSGDRAAVDFILTPAEEGITLSGRVLTADGEPVEGAAVWINNVLVHSVRGGGFTLVLPSHWTARWEITAKKEGVGRGAMTFDVQGRCMKGFEIRLGQETRQPTDFTPAPHGQR